ncbi:MAG: flagellar hook assembly protein FlgD [Deltaproteobacteria bacterium]|nr:flagellar hook assembly protein FlgD [Deltaproteobacteria bacterium]
MSSIDSVSSASSTATEAASSQPAALGRDTFLNLLTTQLQNQDPLNPMDSEAFVEQLATFSSLEQLMGIQSSLEAVYMGIASMNNASMAGLLGTEVVAIGDHFRLDADTPEELHYSASGDAATATLNIYDEDGRIVDSVELGAISEGEGSYTWDGTDMDGNPLPEGEYRFTITATTVDGDDVPVEERVVGTVTEMDYSSGTPQPSVDGVVVDLGDILRLTTGEDGG